MNDKRKNKDIRSYPPISMIILAMTFVIFSGAVFLTKPKPAQAGCFTCSQCVFPQANSTIAHIIQNHLQTRLFITHQFQMHQNWFFGANTHFFGAPDSFFELHALPAMMMMTEQLVTAGMEQMLILGTFFDAKIQLETQQLFQKLEAQAHKDYHPSFGMCVIGTNVRSMAAADRNGELTSYVLSQRSQDRQIGMYSANAALDANIDRQGRIRQVQDRYCDPNDNGGKLGALCTNGKADPGSINKDIDYTRTIDSVRSLNIDFSNNQPTGDEQDVLALASNLFSSDVMDKPGRGPSNTEEAEGPYLRMRSILAKRSVAENSFNSIVGLKTAGTEASEDTILFTEKVLEQMGVPRPDRLVLLGGTLDSGIVPAIRPSYYAQLEILAQKIYQDPEFYTELYDKPANVLRKDVAMQAINLMLERDMYKNELRSEMTLSVLLELELMKYQNDIQNQLNAMIEKREKN